MVRALLDGLDRDSDTPSVVVFDDVHHLQSAAAVRSFATFVQHVPSWLHVVLVGRADPPLPLDRLRVRGQLGEVRFADLRFTDAEARQMLTSLAPDLSEPEIDESARSADGWAAGVQLTGLVARSARGEATAVALRRDVMLRTEDYVWHEVLATADPDIVDTLMQVAVVDRVSTALAAAITGDADVRELLLRAESQGLFVSRLGIEDWFRIHPLVREVLRNELVRTMRHRECHERAARWLERSGEIVSALDQWLLAERPRDALRLLGATSTELYDQGRDAVILRTIAAIPRETAATDVAARIDFAVSHILGPRARFIETVGEAVWHADHVDHDLSPQIDALQSISMTVRGDWTGGSRHARRALAALGDTWRTDPAGRFGWNVIARGIALSESWDDDDPTIRDATIAMSTDPRRGISLEGVRALGHAMAAGRSTRCASPVASGTPRRPCRS